jgi:hypothetical protein
LSIQVAGAELSSILGGDDAWAHVQVAEFTRLCQTDEHITRGRPKLVDSDTGRQLR